MAISDILQDMAKVKIDAKNRWEILLALVAVLLALGLTNLPSIFDNRLVGLIGAAESTPLGLETIAPQSPETAAGVANPVVTLPQTLENPTNNTEFRLEIPRLGIDQKVTPDVDPRDKAIYGPVIEQQVAHGMFTRLPDQATQTGNVYLFAHRNGTADGKNIGFFHRLDELKAGDTATIYYHGRTYTYEFREQFVIAPTDTWVYTSEATLPTLTLQTCENGEAQRLIAKFVLSAVE